jgi:hypothetical protein
MDAGELEILFGIRGYPMEKELKPASGTSGSASRGDLD